MNSINENTSGIQPIRMNLSRFIIWTTIRKKTGQRVGLGQNESFKGCCVVFVGELNFKVGQEVLCEIGVLPKTKAKVAWIKQLEDKITKVGFSMME